MQLRNFIAILMSSQSYAKLYVQVLFVKFILMLLLGYDARANFFLIFAKYFKYMAVRLSVFRKFHFCFEEMIARYSMPLF